MKIESLTSEQIDAADDIRKKWLSYGLSTEPCDKDEVIETIKKLYEANGLARPKMCFYFDSPMAMQCARHYLAQLTTMGDQINDQMYAQISDQMSGQMIRQMSGQMCDQMCDQMCEQINDQMSGQMIRQMCDQMCDQMILQMSGQMCDQISEQMFGQMSDQIRDQVTEQMRGQMIDQMSDQIRDQMTNQMRAQIFGQTTNQMSEQMRGQMIDQIFGQMINQEIEIQSVYFSGGQDCYFMSTYDYAEYCGVKFSEDTKKRKAAYSEYIKKCGWAMLYPDIFLCCGRPSRNSFDDQKLLHSESGPSIQYPDGFSIYSWHGTRIPEEWIEDKNHLTPEICFNCENADQRVCAFAILGWDKVLAEVEHTVIDEDYDPKIGKLIEADFNDDLGPRRFIVAHCPTGRTISVPVDAERKYSTALEANAATYGCSPETYRKYSEFRT